MTNENGNPATISEELHQLGRNLHQIIDSAWESQERIQLEAELSKGLTDLGNSFKKSFEEFSQSETGKQIRNNLDEINQQIQENKVDEKVQSEVINILRKINVEIENSLAHWQNKNNNSQ